MTDLMAKSSLHLCKFSTTYPFWLLPPDSTTIVVVDVFAMRNLAK